MARRKGYVSYLLRLWPAEEEGKVRWRASLESTHGGGRTGFRSLAHLFAFLEDQTGETEEADVAKGGDVESDG